MKRFFFCSVVLHLLLVPFFLSFLRVEAKVLPEKQIIELEMVALGQTAEQQGGGGGGGSPQKVKAEPASAPKNEVKPKVVSSVLKVESAVKTKPTKQTVQRSEERKSISAKPARTGDAEKATGSGNGIGTGNGSGNGAGSGSGNGMGSGNGSGSGSGNGMGSGNGSGSKGYQSPQLLSRTEPVYPSEAREKGLTGRVVVRIQVLTNGRCGSVTVQQSSGHIQLDQAAVNAVHKWRFVPAKEKGSGQPLACYTTVPIVFNLKKL